MRRQSDGVDDATPQAWRPGPLGRLGAWAATHFRVTLVAWLLIAAGLAMFAPKAQHVLSGAGWEASGSESVTVRQLVQQEFGGASSSALMVVVHTDRGQIADPAGPAGHQRRRGAPAHRPPGRDGDPAPAWGDGLCGRAYHDRPRRGKGRHQGDGAGCRRLEEAAAGAGQRRGDGQPDRGVGDVVGFQRGQPLVDDALGRSELYSWPVTLAILVLAFGLPLMLTIGRRREPGAAVVGLRHLDLGDELRADVRAGAGDRLRAVPGRAVPGRPLRWPRRQSPGGRRDDGHGRQGRAVLRSDLTVLVSLSAVMLVPSPAFRSMAAGIMLAVVFVLAATLTLLPAVLGKLGDRVDALALPWVHAGEHRSARFAAWAERLWRRPVAYGLLALAVLVALALPVLGMRTGMPSIAVVPKSDPSYIGYQQVQQAFGPGAPGMLQVVGPAGDATTARNVLAADPGIAAVMPAQPSAEGRTVLIQAMLASDPSAKALGTTVDRLRTELPPAVQVGGAAAENHDLEKALAAVTPLVLGIVLGLGFLLLLVALQAPLAAALGVVKNLLAVGAAFGVGRLIFQDVHVAVFLGFTSQGYVDAWAPVFFFSMIFAISMDYTVFLLSSAKEQWERSHDAHDAMVGGVAHSGRVIFATAVMVAVFFTFAISGPLPPKEMGVVLGVAVLLDALLLRLLLLLLLPVLLRLAGRAGWASPAWLTRILPTVRFSH